ASSFPCDPDQPQYYETFQILYSTTGNNPEDFTLIREYVNIPQQWIEYSAYLPEGTKYFAIRCVSPCQYMLFVDDVTFIAKNAATNTMQVTGYNVYRDNVKLNDEPVEVTTYTDADVDNNSVYKYNVTALYAEGESLKSNDVQVDRSTSSVDAVMASSLRIYTIAGSVVVDGAEGLDISIVTPDGKTIRTVKGETRTVITLSTGMYIVKAGDTVAKVTVK
nr:choice-of-anchor J domain-containing protein [Muribaculaceae bacterium]